MPAKNAVKTYKLNNMYHVYNRGIDKRDIFVEEEDYKKFLSIIRNRLNKKPEDRDNPQSVSEELYGKIKIIAYCLIPNHFHILFRQTSQRTIERFMRSILIRYGMYYNKKYMKSGKLMQGIYKATSVNGPNDLKRVARYIHRNPKDYGLMLDEYKWSSYREYVKNIKEKISILSKEILLDAHEGNIKGIREYTDIR